MRAGKIVTGDVAVMKAVRSGQALLLLVAGDASKATIKKYRDKCRYYEVPIAVCSNRTELGACIGKTERVAIAITDNGFARMIRNCLGNLPEVESID